MGNLSVEQRAFFNKLCISSLIKKENKQIFSLSLLRQRMQENNITEQMFQEYCKYLKPEITKIVSASKFQELIYHPSEKQLEWEKQHYLSDISPSSIDSSISSSKS